MDQSANLTAVESQRQQRVHLIDAPMRYNNESQKAKINKFTLIIYLSKAFLH